MTEGDIKKVRSTALTLPFDMKYCSRGFVKIIFQDHLTLGINSEGRCQLLSQPRLEVIARNVFLLHLVGQLLSQAVRRAFVGNLFLIRQQHLCLFGLFQSSLYTQVRAVFIKLLKHKCRAISSCICLS